MKTIRLQGGTILFRVDEQLVAEVLRRKKARAIAAERVWRVAA